MGKPEILEKAPINIVEVKQALEKIKKTDEELNFRAQKTEEYVQELAKIKPKQAKELYDKMIALDIPRFKEQHAHKLIDLMPTSEKQVKMILTSYHMTIKNDDVKKIANTIAEFSDKK